MTRKELYDDMINIRILVECLADIVRNEMPAPPKEDLLKWAQDMNEIQARVDNAKKNILRYYLQKG
jgi:hypothetical protein